MLQIGTKFKGKWFEGIVEVLSINEEQNSLEVQITRKSDHYHNEDWNYQHTLVGFQQGDYFFEKLPDLSEAIKQNIIYKCRELGMKETSPHRVPTQQFCFIGDGIWVSIDKIGDTFHFSMQIEKPVKRHFYFPIPETLRGFLQVCNVLKIFHNHQDPMTQEELLNIAKAICEQIGRGLIGSYAFPKTHLGVDWYAVDINGLFCVLHFSPTEKLYCIENPHWGFTKKKPFELPETK